MKILYACLVAALPLLGIGGCVGPGYGLTVPVNDDAGTVNYLILGIGLVSVPRPEDQRSVLVTRAHALGLMVSDQPATKVGVGYTSSRVVAVPREAGDVQVQISERVWEPLQVNIRHIP